MITISTDEFANYKQRRGFWFWIMLTIGGFVSNDPSLSARKNSHLMDDFIDSSFYEYVMSEETPKVKNRFKDFYG